MLPVFAIASSYRTAVASLVGLGLASAPLNTAANALASELFPGERGRRMTMLAMAFSSGGLLMPAVTAAASARFSWRGVVVGGAVLAAVTAIAAATRRSIVTRPREASLRSVASFARQPGFPLFCLLLICGAANEGAFAGWTSSYLAADGFTPVAATFGLASHWLGLLAGRIVFAGRVDRAKRRALIRGALLGAGILLAMLVVPARPVLIAGPFAAGVAIAVIVPTALALAGDSCRGNAGTLFGVLLTMAQVGGMALPPLIGAIAERAGLRLALLTAVANALGIALIAWRTGDTRVESASPLKGTT
jgi:fucose permease